jgi:hypothetical protein
LDADAEPDGLSGFSQQHTIQRFDILRASPVIGKLGGCPLHADPHRDLRAPLQAPVPEEEGGRDPAMV